MAPCPVLVGHDGWADGRFGNYAESPVELNVLPAWTSIVPAVVGEDDAPILWGATTLETLGLKPDPVRQVPEPTTLYLLSLTGRRR